MNTSRRGFIGGVSAAALLSASACAFAQKKYDDGASDTEIKIGHTGPYSGPASAYGVIGKAHRGLLEERQRGRRHQRPQGQLHHPRRRLQPAQDGRGACASWSSRTRCCCPVQHARHADQHGDPQVHEPEEGAAALRRDRRVEVGQAQGLPVDDGLPARLPHRGRDLRQAHPGQRQGRQDRRPDAERRLRQGLPRRLQGRASARTPAGSSSTSPTRSTDPTVDSQIIQLKDSGANVFFNICDAEVRRPGDPQGGRHRLEAGAVPEQRLGLGRGGDEAGRLRERARASSPRPTSRTPPTSSGTTTTT